MIRGGNSLTSEDLLDNPDTADRLERIPTQIAIIELLRTSHVHRTLSDQDLQTSDVPEDI